MLNIFPVQRQIKPAVRILAMFNKQLFNKHQNAYNRPSWFTVGGLARQGSLTNLGQRRNQVIRGQWLILPNGTLINRAIPAIDHQRLLYL